MVTDRSVDVTHRVRLSDPGASGTDSLLDVGDSSISGALQNHEHVIDIETQIFDGFYEITVVDM